MSQDEVDYLRLELQRVQVSGGPGTGLSSDQGMTRVRLQRELEECKSKVARLQGVDQRLEAAEARVRVLEAERAGTAPELSFLKTQLEVAQEEAELLRQDLSQRGKCGIAVGSPKSSHHELIRLRAEKV